MIPITLLLLLLYSQITICSIINIPGDQSSIQAGINAANTGDENYISQTKIDGNNQPIIVLASPANEASSIIGFTIQNGKDGIQIIDYPGSSGDSLFIDAGTTVFVQHSDTELRMNNNSPKCEIFTLAGQMFKSLDITDKKTRFNP